MIERYLLRYFLAVVDQGGFSRAATACRVSQPTLSVGIAKLERLVGAPLFHRTSRRVEVTELGARFIDHARKVEAAFASAEAMSLNAETKPLLRLGVLSSLPAPWLEQAIRLARTGPDPDRLEIVEASQKDIGGLLSRGRIDAAIAVAGDDPRTRAILFEEFYGAALPLSHALASHDVVRAEALAAEPMIVRRHCEVLPETSRHFTRRGVRPFMAARTFNDDRAVRLVRAGLGVTVMPLCFGACGIALPRLAGFDLQRRIGLLMESDAVQRVARSPALEAITSVLARAGAAGPTGA